jgi:hyperosmotically inducible periplasmic protein
MKPLNVLMILGLTTVLLTPAPAGAVSVQQPAAQADDDTLESSIETTLKKDSVLSSRDIDVESNRGVVTLTGSVRTSEEKARAARLAKVTGVTSVVNDLKVDPNVDRSKVDAAADKTKAGLNKAVDATAEAAKKTKEGVQKGVGESAKGVGKAAEKTAEAVGTAGDKVSDASLTTRVKSDFSDEPLLKNSAIRVETSNRTVTLRGTVASEAAKARAGEIAKQTSGVARVVNELVVAEK